MINISVSNYIESQRKLLDILDPDSFQAGIDLIVKKFAAGKKIITCGNGGSASTASHYITDWAKMINLSTGKRFRGFSLCDNVGLITAFGNDLSYDQVFSGQLKSIMDEGDLLVAISGSGNSPNVIKAAEYAMSIGGEVLSVVGYDGGELKKITKNSVWVPSFDMQLCEDVHLMFGHMVMKTICNYGIHD
jgi:D-sedoheptulose 7-phosphate isomerase